MLAEPIFIPALTPRTAQRLVEGLPAAARAEARWVAARLTRTLRSLQESEPSAEDLKAVVLEFAGASFELTRSLIERPELMRLALAEADDTMTDIAALARQQLGVSIAGAAADFSLRLLRAFMRFVTERWESLTSDPDAQALIEGTTSLPDLLDAQPEAVDFLCGQVAVLSLCDTLEQNAVTAGRWLPCLAARHLIRSLSAPDFQVIPDPYLGETERQRGERLLTWLRLSSTATTEIEREVILELRCVHLRYMGTAGQAARSVVALHGDILAKLA